ncbi:MAG: hypothetical protein J7483_08865 [Novosphingobium sp.]|nr:hypothetical protein [Novosphingobium sp.]
MNTSQLREFMSPIDRATLPTIDQAARLASETHRQNEESAEEKSFSRGADYASQTRAALKEHEQRMERLTRQRAASDPEGPSESSRDELPVRAGIEISDATQARLDRLREFKSANPTGPPRDRQNEAPGGGRTGGR